MTTKKTTTTTAKKTTRKTTPKKIKNYLFVSWHNLSYPFYLKNQDINQGKNVLFRIFMLYPFCYIS